MSLKSGTFLTQSAEETFELGYEIGESLEKPVVFILTGDLGAGKTVFTKGLAAGLDIDPKDVNSPTFTLVNEHFGRMQLIHLDLYRLPDGIDAAMGIGLDELLSQNAIVVIEWGEKLGKFPVAGSYQINIHCPTTNQRQIEIKPQTT